MSVHGLLKSGSSILRGAGGRICSVSGPSCAIVRRTLPNVRAAADALT